MVALGKITNRLWTAKLLVGLWLLVNVLDTTITQVLLTSEMYKEFNPLLSSLSSLGMWAYKLGATGAIAVLLATFNKVSYLRLATLGIALVVVWNTISLVLWGIG